jgi:hypothetical protein
MVDMAKPEGIDTSRGYCYVCSKWIGTGPRHKSKAERLEILNKWHAISTKDSLRMKNGLASYLLERYAESAERHLRKWDVGTDSAGNCVYWYRDQDGVLQTAKAMSYDSATGKRRKGADSHIRWSGPDGKTTHVDAFFGLATSVHSDGSLRLESFSSERGYSRPLYGSQFLTSAGLDAPVLLVEAEKTAIVASMFLEPFVILATGGAAGLTTRSASVLAGRDVYVLLDADDAGRNALEKAVEILYAVGARPVVKIDGLPLADYLMADAPKGYDLADYYFSQYEMRPGTTAGILQSETIDDAEAPKFHRSATAGILQSETIDDADEIDQALSDGTYGMETLRAITESLPALPNMYENLEGVRSSLLRVFGSDQALTYDEVYRRIYRGKVAGGAQLVNAAKSSHFPKPLLRSELRSNVWYLVLQVKL